MPKSVYFGQVFCVNTSDCSSVYTEPPDQIGFLGMASIWSFCTRDFNFICTRTITSIHRHTHSVHSIFASFHRHTPKPNQHKTTQAVRNVWSILLKYSLIAKLAPAANVTRKFIYVTRNIARRCSLLPACELRFDQVRVYGD